MVATTTPLVTVMVSPDSSCIEAMKKSLNGVSNVKTASPRWLMTPRWKLEGIGPQGFPEPGMTGQVVTPQFKLVYAVRAGPAVS